MKKLAMLNKDRGFLQYKLVDLVYIISPLASQLRTSFRKVLVKYVGPGVTYKIMGSKSFLFCTSDRKLLLYFFEHERLKQTVIRTSHGNVTTLP